jgi:hydroxymethylpyrimidine kinase/phosphomethylpyrimidine kinase
MTDTRRAAPVEKPVVLTIAGSDSGGGAGVQADLKTIEAMGGFGTSAITAVTAQNTLGVDSTHVLPVAELEAQIEAVLSDFDVRAVKTGMLATSELVETVTEYAAGIDCPLVVDPVMVAATGDRLLSADAEAA